MTLLKFTRIQITMALKTPGSASLVLVLVSFTTLFSALSAYTVPTAQPQSQRGAVKYYNQPSYQPAVRKPTVAQAHVPYTHQTLKQGAVPAVPVVPASPAKATPKPAVANKYYQPYQYPVPVASQYQYPVPLKTVQPSAKPASLKQNVKQSSAKKKVTPVPANYYYHPSATQNKYYAPTNTYVAKPAVTRKYLPNSSLRIHSNARPLPNALTSLRFANNLHLRTYASPRRLPEEKHRMYIETSLNFFP